MRKKFKHLSLNDRISMETLLNAGHTPKYIAEYLNVHISTVYREKGRGAYMHRNTDWTETKSYSSDLGQRHHDWAATNKGRDLKIGKDHEYARFLENIIINKKYSPEAALLAAKQSGKFTTTICVNTFYNYIDAGYFLHLTNKQLPVKGNKTNHKNQVRVQKRASAGTSIEKRPDEIMDRDTFGHWEMDTVKGKRGVTKSCLLVLSERKTRDELCFKMKDQKAESVVDTLNYLERKWGKTFYKLFKSITVDNGVEFSDAAGMEKSIHGGQRTKLYYCHPYSSWERGTNENQNKLIRRHIPKGEDIDLWTDKEVSYIEKWINEYPRRNFGGRSSKELFEIELAKLA